MKEVNAWVIGRGVGLEHNDHKWDIYTCKLSYADDTVLIMNPDERFFNW